MTLITNRARNLRNIRRFNKDFMLHPETVAEHSFYTAYYAYIIALDMRQRGISINPELTMRYGLLHDIEEATTGDVSRDYKHATPEIRKTMEALGGTLFARMIDTYLPTTKSKIRTALYSGWADAKSDSEEGRLVEFADGLDALVNMIEERTMGNTTMIGKIKLQTDHLLQHYSHDPAYGSYLREIKQYGSKKTKRRKNDKTNGI